MTRGWTWSASNVKKYQQMASNNTQGALLMRKTLDSYYGNSFLIPTVQSYAILGTAGLLLILTLIFAGTPFLRARFPRSLTQYFKRPTFNRKHAELVQLLPTLPPKKGSTTRRSILSFQMPLRSQTLAILAILIVNLVGIIGFYTPTEGRLNTHWREDSTYIQVVRYVSDRSGILSLAQLILVFLLSGRNSPVQLLTFGAISFETQMLLHRWMARMVVLQALVHSIGYSMYGLHYGKETYYKSFTKSYYIWGVACTVIFFFMLFGAIRNIRQRGYEIFYSLHVLFSVLIIVAIYYHIALLKSENLQDYINWIWVLVSIWIFDRLFRASRQILLNIGFDSSSKTFKFSQASLIFTTPSNDPDHPLILRVRPAGAAKNLVPKWNPGNHVFLNHSRVQPFASHPFTVVSVGNDYSPYLDLVIRPQQGFTRKLIERSRNSSSSSTVFLDGPYGHPLKLHHSFILLIAGGVGITYCLPFFIKEVEKSISDNSQNAREKESQSKKEVQLIWAIKKPEMLCIIVPYLEQVVFNLRQTKTSKINSNVINFCIVIYLTKNPTEKMVEPDEKILEGEIVNADEIESTEPTKLFKTSSVSSDDEKSFEKDEQLDNSNGVEERVDSKVSYSSSEGKNSRRRLENLSPEISIVFKSERPNLIQLIQSTHESLDIGSNGEMAVVTCGPASLCDDSRAISTRLKGVDYYEEGFTW